MPNEPAESDFKHKVKAVAYPTQERGGIVWAYHGSARPAAAAARPRAEHAARQATGRDAPSSATATGCRALEGDIDTSHLGFLHFGARSNPRRRADGTFAHYTVKDRAPRYSVVDTDYGAMYGAYRPAEPGSCTGASRSSCSRSTR